MTESKASNTATIVTRLRAAHQILDDEPKIHVDPIAVGFVPNSSAEELRADRAGNQTPVSLAIRASVVMRNRYVEDVLQEVAASGIRQYVNLGAGFDTFAYRQPAWANALTIYEVDHPDMQRWKQANLQRLGILPPANLRWCPINFEEVGLAEGLVAAGFDPILPTYFAWLGVIPYLTGAAIDAVLRYVLSLPARDTIVFSFVVPDSYSSGEEQATWRQIAAGAAAGGEPWLSLHEPPLLHQHLQTLGFSRVVHLSTEAANARYFAGRSDGLGLIHIEEMMWATV